jgi:hypothetical protein
MVMISSATRGPTGRCPGWSAVGVLILLLAFAGCSWGRGDADPGPRPPTPIRAAGADACTVTSRPSRPLGLPLANAETVRIAPDVVGEKLTWQSGPRRVIAWVGVDALDAFEDLDFVVVHRRAGQPREWTTLVRPELFVAEAATGNAQPCDVLYVSTEGFPADAPLQVIRDLKVGLRPGQDLVDE